MPKARTSTLEQRQAEMATRWQPRQTPWGRPPKKIDTGKLYELAFYHTRNSEMARQLGCDARTLARYAELIALARARAVARLKQAAFRMAVVNKHWPAIKYLLTTGYDGQALRTPKTTPDRSREINRQNWILNSGLPEQITTLPFSKGSGPASPKLQPRPSLS